MDNMQYQNIGFFTTASLTAFHFQDVLIALVLGFAGAFGGWVFKCVKEYIKKRKTPNK